MFIQGQKKMWEAIYAWLYELKGYAIQDFWRNTEFSTNLFQIYTYMFEKQ